jgi:hypothetical protein
MTNRFSDYSGYINLIVNINIDLIYNERRKKTAEFMEHIR